MFLDCIKPLSACISPSSNTAKNETGQEKAPCTSMDTPTDEYDPHQHGKSHHPTVFWGSVFHLIKAMVGAGVLALPYTFHSVGYGVAILGTLVIGVVYVHVLHLLLDVEYRLCKKLRTPNLTYVGVVQNSFEQGPKSMRRFAPAATFLLYFHYTFNESISKSKFLITIAGNFKIILDHYRGTRTSIVMVLSVIIVPLVGLASVRNLKFLVPMSILTNIFNIISMAIILTIPLDYDGSTDLKVITDITRFPYFFGVVVGAFSVTGIILPLKNDTKEPKKFTSSLGILNIASTVTILIFCTFGVLSYAKYGDRIQPNVLFNLPPTQLVSLVVLSLYSLALCISYVLFVYVSFDTVWSNIFVNKKLKYPTASEYALRITFCLLPYIVAVALPDFKIVISLAGVISILMDEAFPVILHFLLLLEQKPRTIRIYLELLKDLTLILTCFGLFIGAFINVIRSIITFYS